MADSTASWQDETAKKSLKKHFLNLCNLYPGLLTNSTINTVVYPGGGLLTLDDCCHDISEDEYFPPSLGISSFQGFQMSSSNILSVNNRMMQQMSPVQQRMEVNANEEIDSFSKENIPKVKISNISYPSILKHKCKDASFISPKSSPMKVLNFSPSRFLNTGKERDRSASLSSCDVVKEQTFSNSSFDVEDSGIGVSDGETTTPLSPPSLTSTPCTKSRRKSSQQTMRNLLSSPEHGNVFSDVSSIPLQSTPICHEDESGIDDFKTPLIRKFLNESAPRTPTPFKCPDDSGNEEESSPKSEKKEEPIHSPPLLSDDCFKRPSPVSWKSKRLRDASVKNKSKKTARKVLHLESGNNIKRNLFKHEEKVSSAISFVNPSTLLHTNETDQSSLVDNKTVVKKTVFHVVATRLVVFDLEHYMDD
ncbi:unnamed protein product [Clavelina lepadiformis]|uniref:Uncharacterized protein n=1 Tax=Clavelina lepadiformis TaxID=159417 RepID=A0ABP0F4J2_CLALP